MINFSYDEYGYFEKNKGLMIIAGSMYVGDDVETERKRIQAYYRAVIGKVSGMSECPHPDKVKYPNSLHFDRNNGVFTESEQKCVERLVKSKVNQSLPEFLKEGSFEGKELSYEGSGKLPMRKGMYVIHAVVNQGSGITLDYKGDLLTNENLGTNRYNIMLYKYLKRVIFHNMLSPGETYNVEVPTRSQNVDTYEERKEYFKQGAYRVGESKNIFTTTSGDTIKAYLTSCLEENIDTKVKIDSFTARPIKYENGQNNEKQEFLYLADSICSDIAFHSDSFLDVLEKCKCLSDKIIVMAYNDVDEVFEGALTAYENQNYFEALGLVYSLTKNNDDISEYYKQTWVDYLIEKMRNNITDVKILGCANALLGELLSSGYDTEKCEYIGKWIISNFGGQDEKIVQNTSKWNEALNLTYISLVKVYTHLGKRKEVNLYYALSKKYAVYGNSEVNDKAALSYNEAQLDALDFAEAVRQAKEMLKEAREEAKRKQNRNRHINIDADLQVNKCLSQCGRALSFASFYEQGEGYFMQAMAGFPDQGQIQITRSYLMQNYIDYALRTAEEGKRQEILEKYEEQATLYFNGAKKPKEIFDFLKKCYKSPKQCLYDVNFRYGMYIYIKSIWALYSDKISDTLWEKIKKLINEAYPNWEAHYPEIFISKYLLLIEHRRGENEQVNRWKSMHKEADGHSIVDLLSLMSDYTVYDMLQDDKKCQELKNRIVAVAKEGNFEIADEFTENEDLETSFTRISTILRYMHA